MNQFDNLPLIYKGSVKDIYQKDDETLIFKFSDRYSIYDWGEMPNHIKNKGKNLALMSALFFKYFEKNGIRTHFKDYKEGQDYIEVEKVDILRPTKLNSQYDYTQYQKTLTNTLIPLEIIFRFGVAQGSSFLKRAHDKDYLESLGLNQKFKEGDLFSEPIIEFSTKLEPQDRYLTYEKAKYISGLSSNEFKQLVELSKKLAFLLKDLMDKAQLELWDGKFEMAYDQQKDHHRSFKLVDSIGLDELRVTKNSVHLSKEILRQAYKDSSWLLSTTEYKNEYNESWKEVMLKDGLRPNKLENEFIKNISQMYQAFTDDLNNSIHGQESSQLEQWITGVNKKKNILVIGSGGREHAIIWKLLQSPSTGYIYITNKDHAILNENNVLYMQSSLKSKDLLSKIKEHDIDLIIIGPEAPLVDGLADELRQMNLKVVGPGKKGAMLEASKDFSKKIMNMANIPTASYQHFLDPLKAKSFVEKTQWRDGFVIKADGLASGKGVIVTDNKDDAYKAIDEIMVQNHLKLDKTDIIIEERLIGKEVSAFALIDESSYLYLGDACDYKRIRDNDQGPNTGGMGTYSPCNWLDEKDHTLIKEQIFTPLVKTLKEQNIPYNGIIFAGLMKTNDGLKVLEFNVRFGDPETQVLMPRINEDFTQLLNDCATNNLSKYKSIKLNSLNVVNIVCAAQGYPGTEGINVQKNDLINIHFENIKHGKVFFAGVKKKEDKLMTNGGRVLGITSWANDLDQARKLAYKNIEHIKFKGMQYRNDIAK